MSDLLPKPSPVKVGGLSRAAQKLQAAREKAANAKPGAKPNTALTSSSKVKASTTGARKTSFQRKAV